MTTWKKFAMAAAGGGTEFVLVGGSFQPGQGYYASQLSWSNWADPGPSGKLTMWRQNRLQNSYTNYIEQYDTDLTYLEGNAASLPANSSANRYEYGRYKMVVDEAKNYDMVGTTSGSAYNWPMDFYSFTPGNGTLKRYPSGNAYPATEWNQSYCAFCYTIGNKVYAGTGDNQQGGAFGAFDFTLSSNNVQNPGIKFTNNSTPGSGGFIDGKPVDPTSASTNHLLVYASNFETQFFEFNSSFGQVASKSVGFGDRLQYWSNAVYDSDEDCLYIYNSNSKYLYRWDRSTGTINLREIEVSSGARVSKSMSLALVNGYLYLTLANRNGSVFLRMNATNGFSGLSTGYSAVRFTGTNTAETSTPFLVPGPNEATGETDLLYFGLSWAESSDSSFQSIWLAVCKFDNLTSVAGFCNNLGASTTGVTFGTPFTSGGTGGNKGNLGTPGSAGNPSTSNSFFYESPYPGMITVDGPNNL